MKDHWFIDSEGVRHYLCELPVTSFEVVQHKSWTEIMILGEPDGEGPGRNVLDAYVLHDRREICTYVTGA